MADDTVMHTCDWTCRCGLNHVAPGTCGRCGAYGQPASFPHRLATEARPNSNNQGLHGQNRRS